MATTWIIRSLAVWGAAFAGLLLAGTWHDHEGRAIAGMAACLILLWVVLCGGAMYRWRDDLAPLFHRLPGLPPLAFAIGATILALIEEAITVSLSNAAPLFGVQRGDVMITPSLNYFDVVLRHSVIVFVPMFLAWGWLLNRYAIRPAHVFLLFGLTGTLAETLSFGPQMLIGIGQWTFVYGLMVWLPAYAMADKARRTRPRPLVFPAAIILPLMAAMPVAIAMALLS